MAENRIAVAMSGGVDSSVAAAFLKKKGYDVIGLTMQLQSGESRCCSIEDIEDAKKVAWTLGIPHYVIPLQEVFQRVVIDYFISEYINGKTPNPCALCNPLIKFGVLLKKAAEVGAERFATGHYAVVHFDQTNGRYLLKRGKDRGKDQSYFLARLSQESLKKTIFPVGRFPKNKIKELANRFHLPVADKKESQEVCFVPDDGVSSFIEKEVGPFSPGPILDENNRCVGIHRGISGYTIGQRKGLGISLGKPVYVIKIDVKTNTVVVGGEKYLYKMGFHASDSHWISIPGLMEPMRSQVRIRYNHRAVWARITPRKNGEVDVQFEQPQRAIAPGQLAVFYDGDTVIGSAWIQSVMEE